MAGWLVTNGWVEVYDRHFGEPFAFCADGGTLWVRRHDGKYKFTQVGGSDTIDAATFLAGIISHEQDHWWTEANLVERDLRPPADEQQGDGGSHHGNAQQ